MKKSILPLFFTLFLLSFQSHSAIIPEEEAESIYEQALIAYDNAYDVMTNESDFVSRGELNRNFIIDNSAGGPEDTTTRSRIYVKGEREDYRQALVSLYASCSGQAQKLQLPLDQEEIIRTRDTLARAQSLYSLCARQAAHELEYYF